MWIDKKEEAGATEKKEGVLLNSKYVYRQLFENNIDGVIIICEGRIVEANKAFCDILGLTMEETLGGNPSELIHPEDDERGSQRMESILEGGLTPDDEDFRVMRKDGSFRWVEMQGKRIEWQGRRAILLIVRDTSKRREIEIHQAASYKIADAASKSTNLEELFGYIHHELGYLTNAKNFYIALYDDSQKMITFPYYADENHPERLHTMTSRKFGNGLTEYIIKTGDALLVSDEEIQEMGREGKIDLIGVLSKTWLGVPLVTREKIIGVMAVQNYERSDAYKSQDKEFLEFISHQIASTIERKKSEEELRRRTKELTILNELAQALTAHLSVVEVLKEAYRQVTRLVDTTNFYIALYDQEKEELIFPFAVDSTNDDWSPIKKGEGLTSLVIETKEAILLPTGVSEESGNENRYGEIGPPACSWLGVPLMVSGRVLGVMTVQSYTTPNLYNVHDLELLTSIANQTAIVIQNAQLYEQAQQKIAEHAQAEKIQSVLYKIANAANTAEDLEGLYKSIREFLGTIVDTANFYIALYDKETDTVSTPYYSDEWDSFTSFPAGKSLTSYVIKKNKPLLATWKEIEELEKAGEVEHVGTPSKVWLGVPLRITKEVIGIVAVQSYTDESLYTEKDLRILEFVSGQIAIAIDRRRAEEALRQSEASLAEAQKISRVGNFELELSSDRRKWSEEMFRIFGFDPATDSPPGKEEYMQMVHPEDRENFTNKIDDIIQKSIEASFEFRIVSRNGILKYLLYSGKPILDEYGKTAKIFGTVMDISERKSAERKLSAIHKMTKELALSLDVDRIVDATLDIIQKVLEYNDCSLGFVDDERHELFMKSSRGFPKEYENMRASIDEKSIACWVAKHGQSLLVPDVSKDERYLGLMPEIRSELCVPLRIKEKTIGVLDVESETLDAFDNEDLMILETLASEAAVAIQNALFYEEKEKRIKELAALNVAFHDIASRMDLKERLELTVKWAAHLLQARGGGLYLYDKNTDELELAISFNLGVDFTGVKLARGEGLCGRVLLTRKPFAISDYSSWEGRSHKFEETPFKSILGVPILWNNEVMGVMEVSEDAHTRKYSKQDINLLENFANTVAVMILNSRLYEEKRKSFEEVSAFYEATKALSSILDLKTLFSEILTIVRQNFDYDIMTLFLIDEGTNEACLVDGFGVSERVGGMRLKVGMEGIVGMVAAEGVMQLWNDISKCPYYIRGEKETKSEITVPLKIRDKVIGVIDIQKNKINGFDERDMRIFHTMSVQISKAIENAKLYEEIKNTKMQIEFINDLMSHDLSNINQIALGNIEMISLIAASERQKKFITSARSAIRRSARLVTNVKVLKMMIEGQEKKEKTDLSSIIEKAAENVSDYPGKKVTIETVPRQGALVMADDYLAKAFENLIDNAIKFSPTEHARVAISIIETEHSFRVEVKDWGKGISDAMKKDIFHRYERLSEGKLGSGLGLYATKRIVEAHSGKIWAEDNPEGGSIFCVQIPKVG